MASKMGFVKGLAAGAVLGAVASVIASMNEKERDEKLHAIKVAAMDIKTRVDDHAKSLGKLSKAAYEKIVDATVAEYRGLATLSEGELKHLKKDLLAGWKQVEKIVKGTTKKAKKK